MAEAEPSSSHPNNPVHDVDTSFHARGLWLLKVPKYLAEKWDSAEDGKDIGQIEFVKKPNSTAQNIVFRVSADSVNSGAGDNDIPLSHTLKMVPCDNVSMMVFSQNKDGIKIEGKIAQRADIQVDASYMNQYMSLKRKKIETTEATKKKKYEPIMLPNNPNKIYSTKYKDIHTQYCNKLILAPMVRMGTLPFRLLCLEYGADLVFSEEIVDHKLVKCRRVVNPVLNTIDFVDNGCVAFRTCATEKERVVLQIGTASAERATKIAELVGTDVSGIDVNMGCPKNFSVKGGMGVALLNSPDRISEIMPALVKTSRIPVTCKIRILPTLDRTRVLLKLIESTGVSAVSIHGRTAAQRRTEPNQNDVLTAICTSPPISIPIIANGMSAEVSCHSDIQAWNERIGSDSIMLARAAQRNPSIFRKSGLLPVLEMSRSYLTYAIDYDNPYGNTLYCLCNIMHSEMDKEVGHEVSSSRSMAELSKAFGLSEYYEQAVAKRKSIFNSLVREDRDILRGVGLVYSDAVKSVPEVSEYGVVELHIQCRKRVGGVLEASSPKEKLLKWASKNPDLEVAYTTKERSSDRRFKSVLRLGGESYSSSYWEKSKKLAEHAAASVAIQVLGIGECD